MQLRVEPIIRERLRSGDEVRWIGRLDVFCFDVGDTRFPFTATDGPFGNWVPVELFEHMMDMLGRSRASRT